MQPRALPRSAASTSVSTSALDRRELLPACGLLLGLGERLTGRLGLRRRLVVAFGFLLNFVRQHLRYRAFGLGVRALRGGFRDSVRLGLRSLEGRQFLFRGKLTTLGDDEEFDLDVHVLEELDRDRVATDALDRVDRDLAPVDANLPGAPDLVGDVRR